MGRSPHNDEVQAVAMPAGEKVLGPVQRWMLGSLAAPLLQLGNHGGHLSINRRSQIVAHFGLRRRFRLRPLPSSSTHRQCHFPRCSATKLFKISSAFLDAKQKRQLNPTRTCRSNITWMRSR